MNKESNVFYSNSIKYSYRLAPIVIIMLFYLLTLVFFEFGPIDWPITNKWLLYIYLFLAYIFMFIGYLTGIRNKKIVAKSDNIKIFYLFLFIYIIMLPLTSYGRTGNFIPNIFNQGLDFGALYYSSAEYRIAWPEYIRFIFAPALFAVFPLGIFLWRKLGKKIKSIYVLSILYYVFIDISRGTNKSIADHVVLLIMVGLLVLIINQKKKLRIRDKFKKIKSYQKVLLISISIILLITFINIFTLFISSRTLSTYNQYAGTYIDLNNSLLSFSDDETQKYGLAMFMYYLSQGYYGLSLALDKPFIFSYGFGYSSFLLENISQLGLENIKLDTYAYRLYEDNWPTGMVWSSFFVWPASDITFLGVLLLMGIIGYVLGSTWVSSLLGNDYVSLIVFSLLCILAFYVPMNNQLFQGGELFIASWFWIGLWGLNKIKIKLRK